MVEYVMKYEKLSVLLLNVVCKIAGIAIICLYIKEQITILLPIGAFTFFIPSFGCGGAFFESRCLLLTYCALLMAFLLAQMIVLMYYIIGIISPEHGAYSPFELEFHKFTTGSVVFLHITATLELMAGILSFRLAGRLKQASNDYRHFKNGDEDADNMSILSIVLPVSEES